jgi:16S rRNA (uracil1498-N3)-methyltransferase
LSVPFFYIKEFNPDASTVTLDEAASRHISGVLRMKPGEVLNLTDGLGNLYYCILSDNDKKKSKAEIKSKSRQENKKPSVSIGISLLKNPSRFEWFLEKATEIGVQEIIPLLSERTERSHFRHDRMQQILISALLQSQQTWLPVLHEPVSFESLMEQKREGFEKLIAHCEPTDKKKLKDFSSDKNKLILIGPEGDFSPTEIQSAIKNNFIPVSLGNTRLRTETAGMVAVSLLCS